MTGQYMGTHFKEVLSYRFIFSVYKNNVRTLVEKDFMKEIIYHLLGTYQREINIDIIKFNVFMMGLILNIWYMHVPPGDCLGFLCSTMISKGRLNPWLIGIRSITGLYVLNILKEEFNEITKKGTGKYLSDF